MRYFKIKGFDKFQHYKDRNPPWIKLYSSLLSDLKFNAMTDSQQITLIKLWVLSSQNGNRLAYDSQLIRRQLASNSRVSLDFFAQAGWIEIYSDSSENDSKMLCLVQSTEKEIEREKEIYINGDSNKTAENQSTPPTKKPEFVILDLDYARAMREDILKMKPDFHIEDSDEDWAGAICFLRRARKISPQRILEVWDFARGDEFWRSVILTPWNLQKHFDKLELALNPPEAPKDHWEKVKQDFADETERAT